MCYCFLTVIFSYLLCIIFYCFFCLFYFFFFFFFFLIFFFFFFFQAEDGIRDADVTGDQTCALPISATVSLGAGYFLFEYVEENPPIAVPTLDDKEEADYYGFQLKHRQFSKEGVLSQELSATDSKQIGRASCRERV